MTARDYGQYVRLMCSETEYLNECYARPSFAKIKAYYDCKKRARLQNADRVRITSYNAQQFTMAWTYPNPTTGVMMLHYETAHTSRDVEVSLTRAQREKGWQI